MSNVTGFQWDDLGRDGEQGCTELCPPGMALPFPGKEEEDSGAKPHFQEVLTLTADPQNSPKVSGGSWGVGQINGKCHWDWVQGSLPWESRH